jgi:hypothetical protein
MLLENKISYSLTVVCASFFLPSQYQVIITKKLKRMGFLSRHLSDLTESLPVYKLS